jgi:hypothetical protein
LCAHSLNFGSQVFKLHDARAFFNLAGEQWRSGALPVQEGAGVSIT